MMSLPADASPSAASSARPGCGTRRVMSLPPSWPQAREVSTTALRLPLARRSDVLPGADRAGHRRLRPPLVAVRLVRQRDQLGDVRELGRELAEARVDLGRVHVARREVLQEAVRHRRQAAAEPRPGRAPRSTRPCSSRCGSASAAAAWRAGLADAHELAVLDVRVRRRVRVDVDVHHARRRSRSACPAPRVPRERQRRAGVGRAGRRRAAEPRLRLDREEAAGVVLEVVDAQDDDLVLVRAGCRRARPSAAASARFSACDVGLAVRDPRRARCRGPSIVAPSS